MSRVQGQTLATSGGDRALLQVGRLWALPPLAGIVALQVVLLSRQLDIRAVSDEANYVLSSQALEHGETIGRQIFISQPPGFFLWLWGLMAALGDTLRDARIGMIATAVIGGLALYVVGAALVGPLGGLAAAALFTIMPPLPIEGAQVYADTPAYAFGAVAVALAALRRPAIAGVLLTVAVSCKLSGVIAIPPVLALVWLRSEQRPRALAACIGGALASAGLFAAALARDLPQIWAGVVSYHVTSVKFNGFSATHLIWHDSTWIAIGLLAAALAVTVTRARWLWPLWLWPLTAVVFLYAQHPLHDNHLLVLPYSVAGAAGPALATLARDARPLGAVAAVAAGAAVVAAGYVQQLHGADGLVHGQDPRLVAAARALDRVTKPGALVVSDQGIVALMAHRPVPGQIADSSVMRFAAGNLTPADVQRLIATEPVQAVVAGRAFVIPQLDPTFAPMFRRDFAHVLRLPAASIYYGRRHPPRAGLGSG